MTASRATVPPPPKVELETVRETLLGGGGFLRIRRIQHVALHDGVRSAAFEYDVVTRDAIHATVMAAHHAEGGRVWVWLRSCVRPPLQNDAVLWELPAGLIEPGERPRACAARELAEELGFTASEQNMLDLGPPTHPAPALIGEVHHFFHVEVDPAARREPEGDGSPVEAGGVVICVPLDEALDACRRGAIRDEKTELGLRRLADVLGR